MELKDQNILMFTRTMNLGGTENIVIELCEFLRPIVNKVVVCSCGGVNEKKLKELKIKHYTIPDITNHSVGSVIDIIKKIKYIVKTEDITIVHSHHRMAAFYTELLFTNNIIKIANAHNTFYDKVLLTRFSYRRTFLIAVGNNVKENLIDFYKLPLNQIKVIYNSINPFNGNISTLKELDINKKNGYVLIGNIGRLSKQKGMRFFISAIANVIRVCPNAKFFIIGDGEEKFYLRKLAKKILPEDTLQFLGYREDIQSIMAQLDIIVLSSLWEGLPLTPIEACSVGKPIIATDVGGTSEIVKNNINGLLVKAEDVKELSEAMIELINDSEKRNYLGINAYKFYREKFSIEKMREQYIDFYEQAVNAKKVFIR